MNYEQKYQELLTATANMRRLQKEYLRCHASATLKAAKRAETKVDELINVEISKAIQLQQAMNFGK